ncbi:hypothetical protein [Mycoplasma seminis]|uniref:Uncharacterized protein n=1 Tax=Mycoplasma seminis TaxID=512749 RepID=A0ABY9HBF4_9MOLU|nr:hypothetical protein [Mycoplasma seminis]WLP85678.1 hypothetical protein Q8852_00775 [Mycoplasma seminis]
MKEKICNINIEEIRAQILNNKGLTITFCNNYNFQKGYAVGIKNYKTISVDFKNMTKDQENIISDSILEIVNEFDEKIGVWYDEKDKKLYIDKIKIYYNKKHALKIAKSNNQKAIWDFKHKKEIWI